MFLDKVKEVLVNNFENVEDKITLESDLVNDLGLDSLDLVEVVAVLEEEYDIRITDDKAMMFVTVEDIVEYLEGVGR